MVGVCPTGRLIAFIASFKAQFVVCTGESIFMHVEHVYPHNCVVCSFHRDPIPSFHTAIPPCFHSHSTDPLSVSSNRPVTSYQTSYEGLLKVVRDPNKPRLEPPGCIDPA